MIPQIEFAPNAAAPLDGIRVVDLSRLVAGNMLSLQIADQGAEAVSYTHLTLPTICSV